MLQLPEAKIKTLETENLIVGSGAGGSTVFSALTSAGEEVLMVEEGPEFSRSTPDFRDLDLITSKYRFGGLQPVFGRPGFAFGEGMLLGGSTEVNGGLFWRLPEFIQIQWEHLGVFGSLSHAEIISIFDHFERELSVSSAAHRDGFDRDSSLLAEGAARNSRFAVEVPRAGGHLCQRSNRCAVGCPVGAKQSMTETLIPKGRKWGGQVRTGFRGLRLRVSRGIVNSLEGRDSETGEKIVIRAKRFFLGCGPIQSPLLLKRSGLKIPSSIGFHLNAKVVASFREPVKSEKATIFTTQVQDFLEEGFVYMPTAFSEELLSVELGDLARPKFDHLLEMRDFLGMYTLQVRPSATGRIMRFRDSPLITLTLNSYENELLKRAALSLADDLFAAGAVEIFLPLRGRPSARSPEQLSGVLRGTSAADWILGSVHGMASLPRLGGSHSPIGQDGRHQELPNLWVIDSSGLPSTTGESPQGAIMALARTALIQAKLVP